MPSQLSRVNWAFKLREPAVLAHQPAIGATCQLRQWDMGYGTGGRGLGPSGHRRSAALVGVLSLDARLADLVQLLAPDRQLAKADGYQLLDQLVGQRFVDREPKGALGHRVGRKVVAELPEDRTTVWP